MIQDFGWSSVEFLARASLWTIGLSIIAFLIGGAIGLTLALLRVLGPRPVRLAIAGYIQIVQA
ncbi:MAG: amino acid ABC transporter permease, partial [Bauldia litoralis]